MGIAGHVPSAMLSRYSHVRMEAKRRALDEIAALQHKSDEQRRAISAFSMYDSLPTSRLKKNRPDRMEYVNHIMLSWLGPN